MVEVGAIPRPMRGPTTALNLANRAAGIPGVQSPGQYDWGVQKSSLLDSYTLEPKNSTEGVRVPRTLSYPDGMPGALTTTRAVPLYPRSIGQPASWADYQAGQNLPGNAPTPLQYVPRKYNSSSYLPRGAALMGTSGLRVPLVPHRTTLLHEATHAGQDLAAPDTRYHGNPAFNETAAMASEVQEAMREGWTPEQLSRLNSNNQLVPGWVYEAIRKHGPKFDGTSADVQRARDFGYETRFGTSELGTRYRDFVRTNGWDPTPAEATPRPPVPNMIRRPYGEDLGD